MSIFTETTKTVKAFTWVVDFSTFEKVVDRKPNEPEYIIPEEIIDEFMGMECDPSIHYHEGKTVLELDYIEGDENDLYGLRQGDTVVILATTKVSKIKSNA